MAALCFFLKSFEKKKAPVEFQLKQGYLKQNYDSTQIRLLHTEN